MSDMSDMSDKIKMLEKENASMRECISSVLMRLADYDGYKGHAPGLESIIDCAMETLSSGYPERLQNWEGREVCPLCFEVLKGDGIVITIDSLLGMLNILNVEKLSKLVESDYFSIMREGDVLKEEEKYKVLTEKIGKFLKLYEADLITLKQNLGEFYDCNFCDCNTNAKIRACCEKGRKKDESK